MKRIFLVPAILVTSFSYGMDEKKDFPVKRSSKLSLPVEITQSSDQKIQLRKSPRISLSDEKEVLRSSPRQPSLEKNNQISSEKKKKSCGLSLTQQFQQLSTVEKEKQKIREYRSVSHPIDVEQKKDMKVKPDIVRARAQSNGSPDFVRYENIYGLLNKDDKEQKK